MTPPRRGPRLEHQRRAPAAMDVARQRQAGEPAADDGDVDGDGRGVGGHETPRQVARNPCTNRASTWTCSSGDAGRMP